MEIHNVILYVAVIVYVYMYSAFCTGLSNLEVSEQTMIGIPLD